MREQNCFLPHLEGYAILAVWQLTLFHHNLWISLHGSHANKLWINQTWFYCVNYACMSTCSSILWVIFPLTYSRCPLNFFFTKNLHRIEGEGVFSLSNSVLVGKVFFHTLTQGWSENILQGFFYAGPGPALLFHSSFYQHEAPHKIFKSSISQNTVDHFIWGVFFWYWSK